MTPSPKIEHGPHCIGGGQVLQPCSTTAPTLLNHCTNTAQPLRQPCSTTAPTLLNHCTNTAQPLRQHCSTTAPTLLNFFSYTYDLLVTGPHFVQFGLES